MKRRSRWQVAGDFSLAGGAFLSVQRVQLQLSINLHSNRKSQSTSDKSIHWN
jgi:hypothetical protein